VAIRHVHALLATDQEQQGHVLASEIADHVRLVRLGMTLVLHAHRVHHARLAMPIVQDALAPMASEANVPNDRSAFLFAHRLRRQVARR
jgi:hypothetical protein